MVDSLKKTDKILCVCNYGQVRSKCMENRLKLKGYKNVSPAIGACHSIIYSQNGSLEKVFSEADKIICLNWKNANDGWRHDLPPIIACDLLALYDKYKDKFMLVSTVEYDRWGDPNHPALIELCDKFIEENGEK